MYGTKVPLGERASQAPGRRDRREWRLLAPPTIPQHLQDAMQVHRGERLEAGIAGRVGWRDVRAGALPC